MVERLHVSTDWAVVDEVLAEEVVPVLSSVNCCLFSLLCDVCLNLAINSSLAARLLLQSGNFQLEIS